MNDKTIAELARKNRDLRQLVSRLAAILLHNAVDQRQHAARQVDIPMSPVERVGRVRELSMHSGQLREISMRLMQIALSCREADAAAALRGLAGEFADEAGQVDTLIATTRE